MWLFCLGPSSSEAALEPVSYPVWQQHRNPLRRHALSLLHSLHHHRGAGLLHHRQSHGTHERQELPRHGRLHLKVRQPFRLSSILADAPSILPTFLRSAARLEHRGSNGNSPVPIRLEEMSGGEGLHTRTHSATLSRAL